MVQHITLREIMDRARRILADAGLVPGEHIDLSGNTVCCGTTKKPQGTDGRYKIHADFPPTIGFANYHDGGKWQNCQLWKKSELSAMTQAEKEALRERIKKEQAAAKAKKQDARASAAERAAREFSSLSPAGSGLPYLKKKGVPALGEAKQTKDGRLVLPMRNADGRLTSLQYISHDGSKRFLKGGEKAGCFFAIPAKGGEDSGLLLIAEGYATAASVHLATGYAALVAFDAGNLLPVANAARRLFPEREILLCADNDLDNTRQDGSPCNPGKEKAEEAALAVGGKVALCPAINGRAADFNDLFTHTESGPERVQAIIEKARLRGNSCPIPDGFRLVPDGPKAGLYHIEEKKDGSLQEFWLGPPLLIHGWTRDADGEAWGLYLEWKDPDGQPHTYSLPLAALSLDSWDWLAALTAGGWLAAPRHKRKIAAFFSRLRPSAFIRCVPRVGWHGSAFVLPDVAIGNTAQERVVLQAGRYCLAYRQKGTLEEWQRMAALCAGNSRLVLALCVAFAGPLLLLSGLESGGFNLVGGSSTGKSTAQRLAASVWDAPEFVRSWRTSDNGLEGLAALHNDTALILDELGQAPPKTISEAAYMLGSGQGKGRAERNGFARKSQQWRLLFLSSGEVTLAAKMAESGKTIKPGQEVRFADLEAEAGAGMGVIEKLHGFPDSGALVRYIQETSRQHYGYAGRKFLEYVTGHFSELEADTGEAVRSFVRAVSPPNSASQVERVAERFGLCAFAGVIAVKSGVLPLSESDVWEGVKNCFEQWLKDRGTAGALEDAAILRAVRLFIEQFGAARFQDKDAKEWAQCFNRVGFREKSFAENVYLFLPETFEREVLPGYPKKKALEVLSAAGWLVSEGGRTTVKRELPGLGRKRCIAVKLPEDNE